jgi:hypothetical protein
MKVEKGTRNRLTEFGKKGETYDQILNKLMDFYEKHHVAREDAR